MEKQNLLKNQNQIHTTPMGVQRISRNLNLANTNVVTYCIDKIKQDNCLVYIKGKNYYCEVDDIVITINQYSYTIITAHKVKENNK